MIMYLCTKPRKLAKIAAHCLDFRFSLTVTVVEFLDLEQIRLAKVVFESEDHVRLKRFNGRLTVLAECRRRVVPARDIANVW